MGGREWRGLSDLIARMGHDSERAAIIYQHEARGADAAITYAIDAHVESKQGKGGDDGGALGIVVHTANGTGASSGLLRAECQGRAYAADLGLCWSG